MKRICLLSVILLWGLLTFAQEPDQKFSLSLGPEWNMNSGENFAAALALGFTYNLQPSYAIGLTVTGSSNFSGNAVIEPSALFRWYFLGKNHAGFFAQADLGAHYSAGDGETKTVLSGGIRGGFRLPLGKFFIEPYGRFGYPFFFGIGVMGGIRLNKKSGPYALQESEDFTDGIRIIHDADDHIRIQVTSIIFRSNSADFEGLSEETLASNAQVLEHIAALLKRNSAFRIIVEGHANPTTQEGPARIQEEIVLLRLSEQRAHTIAEELVKLGINRNRISTQGAGATKLLAPYNDTDNNWKNRRVDFILIRIKGD